MSTTELARRTVVHLSIDGHDATAYTGSYLKELTFTDNLSGTADELSFTLHDRDRRWVNEWKPKVGSKVACTITATGFHGNSVSLPCGEFSIDEIEYKLNPLTLTIKATSTQLTSDFRERTKSRAWEGKGLNELASQIASENGLSLSFEGNDHVMRREDQDHESDLAFISRNAAENGMICKVHDGRLIMRSYNSIESQSSILTIVPADDGNSEHLTATSGSFKEKSSDAGYKKATATYADPDTGTSHSVEVESIDE